jgi:two-component system cell cycle sensor histidine kinase/response regulator CckA
LKDFGNRQRELLVAILEETSDFVGTADPKGRILYINRGGRRLCGVPDDADVTQYSIGDFHPQWAVERVVGEGIPDAILHGVWRGSTAVRTREGREVPVSQVIVAHRNAEGEVTYLSTIIRDISELLAAEDASREANQKLADAHDLLAAIIRNAPSVAIQGFDRNGVITFWNPASERLYGFSAAEAVGKKLADLILGPEEAADWTEQARRSVESGSPMPLLQWETKSRQGEVRTVLSSTFPVGRKRPEGSRTTELVCMDVDITAHVRAEQALLASVEARRTLEEQLVHAQRLESIGRLAGGVAHDFNNLLTVILGYVSLAEQRQPLDAELEETLEHVREAAERGASLVSQLLAFARRQLHKPRAIELGALVRRLEHLLRRVLGEDLNLEVFTEEQLIVSADTGQLEQVLINLAVNSRDAMRHGGTLTIRTKRFELSEERARSFEIAPGNYAELVVSDTGSGMSDEVKQRAFEPFFTTKPFGVDTGLGLATCYGIVRQHGGAIWIDSRIGHGTDSHILLPLTQARPERERRGREPPKLGREARVLVVEDEPAVRNVTLRILARAGVEAVGAASPEEARKRMTDSGEFDAIVSDVVMPGVSGPELVAELRRNSPKLRVLFVTGYSTDVALEGVTRDARTSLLQKPFTPDALMTALGELLDRT